MHFDLHIGIDYSGAETPISRIKGLQVYEAFDGPPERSVAVPEEGKMHWNWSRQGVANHLVILAVGGIRFIAGIDHGFSFTMSYLKRYHMTSWDGFLDDFAGMAATAFAVTRSSWPLAVLRSRDSRERRVN